MSLLFHLFSPGAGHDHFYHHIREMTHYGRGVVVLWCYQEQIYGITLFLVLWSSLLDDDDAGGDMDPIFRWMARAKRYPH